MKHFIYIFLFITSGIFAQESLSWGEASVSDKIPLTISKAEFDKRYKTDSITEPDISQTCGRADEENAQALHYKGVTYVLNNGMLNFRKIDFRKRRNMWLAFENDWFDHTTTFKNFLKTYPDATAISEEFIDDEGEIFELVTILPAADKKDFEWHFYFAHEKLQYIECFLYCN